MKTGVLVSAVFLLIAQEGVPAKTEFFDPIARLGAVGVLGFIVVFMITKTLPGMAKTWSESLDKLNKTLTELRIHCAERQKDE